MSRSLGAMLVSVIILLAASGPAAAQADDLSALYQHFRVLSGQGEYAEAATIGERMLKIIEQAHGPNAPATATALNNLAIMYWKQGRYEEALKAYSPAALTLQVDPVGVVHQAVEDGVGDGGVPDAPRLDV